MTLADWLSMPVVMTALGVGINLGFAMDNVIERKPIWVVAGLAMALFSLLVGGVTL